MEKRQWRTAVGMVWEALRPFVGQMVGIHREFCDPSGQALVEGIFDKRSVKNRNQWLWKDVSERTQSCPQPRSEKKGSLDHGAHVRRVEGQRMRCKVLSHSLSASLRVRGLANSYPSGWPGSAGVRPTTRSIRAVSSPSLEVASGLKGMVTIFWSSGLPPPILR